MKKILLCLVLVFAVSFLAMPQTPQYYNFNTGTSSNSFPFNVAGGKAVNSLFLAGEFNQPSPCPSGKQITTVYFRTSTTGSRTYTNFHILMAQDSSFTTLTTGTFYPGPWDTVYFNASVTLNSVAAGWMSVTLDTPYPYDPTKSFLLFVGHCGATGSGGSVYNTTGMSGIRRVWSVGGCPFAPYAGGDASLVNFGFDAEDIPVPSVWSEVTSGLTSALYSVSAVDNNVAWTCGASGKVLRTVNSGLTWTSVGATPIPTTLALYNIFGIDSNTALVTGSSSTATFVYRTSDAGSTWTQVLTETGGFLDGIVMSSASNGFIYGDPVGGRWSLWKTTNGGVNWDSAGLYVAETSLAGWNNAMFNLGNSWWFGTNGTNLKYSSDNGVTWGNQVTPAANQYAMWFNNATNGLAGGANLYATTDGGTTWSNLTSIGSGNISGIVGMGNNWWFTRQATAVNFSSDNGATWSAQYTAPAGSFYHIAKARSGYVLFGVRSNGGIARYGPPLTGVTPVVTISPKDYNLSQNYPNPFNPVTRIEYSIPKSGLVTIKVYDVLGREVATLVNEVQTAGSYNINFDASQLASGIYLYKIKSGDFTAAKRMMLIK